MYRCFPRHRESELHNEQNSLSNIRWTRPTTTDDKKQYPVEILGKPTLSPGDAFACQRRNCDGLIVQSASPNFNLTCMADGLLSSSSNGEIRHELGYQNIPQPPKVEPQTPTLHDRDITHEGTEAVTPTTSSRFAPHHTKYSQVNKWADSRQPQHSGRIETGCASTQDLV